MGARKRGRTHCGLQLELGDVAEYDAIAERADDGVASKFLRFEQSLCRGYKGELGREVSSSRGRTESTEGPSLVAQKAEILDRRHDLLHDDGVPPVLGLVRDERVVSEVDPC